MNNKKIDYMKEIIMTFSTQKSLFSSKKIERFVVFHVFLTITVIYLAINIRTIDSLDFIQVCGLWLAYGGYNSMMSLKDKKVDNQSTIDQSQDSSQQSESTSGEEEEKV